MVEGGGGPLFIFYFWWDRIFSGLKSPMIGSSRFTGSGGAVHFFDAWIGSPHPDPVFEIGNLIGGKHPFGGHLKIHFGVTNGMDQPAFFGLTRNDDLSAVAPFHPGFPGIEAKASFDFFGFFAMAFV